MLVAELGMLKEVVGGVSRQFDPLRTLRLKAAQRDQMIAIHFSDNFVKAWDGYNYNCGRLEEDDHIGRNLGHNWDWPCATVPVKVARKDGTKKEIRHVRA